MSADGVNSCYLCWRYSRVRDGLLEGDALVGVGVIGGHVDCGDLGSPALWRASTKASLDGARPSSEVMTRMGRVASLGARSGKFQARRWR